MFEWSGKKRDWFNAARLAYNFMKCAIEWFRIRIYLVHYNGKQSEKRNKLEEIEKMTWIRRRRIRKKTNWSHIETVFQIQEQWLQNNNVCIFIGNQWSISICISVIPWEFHIHSTEITVRHTFKLIVWTLNTKTHKTCTEIITTFGSFGN